MLPEEVRQLVRRYAPAPVRHRDLLVLAPELPPAFSARKKAPRGTLEETLTVKRLGLTGALARTLRTTNIIENLMGSVEGYTRRVKRWRGGQMIQRWVASALVEAEPRFRRVRGYRDLRYLVGALDALAPPAGAIADVA